MAKFKVGDRVRIGGEFLRGFAHYDKVGIVTRVNPAGSWGDDKLGYHYYTLDIYAGGVWENYLTLEEENVSRKKIILTNREHGYTLPAAELRLETNYGWDVRFEGTGAENYFKKADWDAEIIDPPIPLPTEPGTTFVAKVRGHWTIVIVRKVNHPTDYKYLTAVSNKKSGVLCEERDIDATTIRDVTAPLTLPEED